MVVTVERGELIGRPAQHGVVRGHGCRGGRNVRWRTPAQRGAAERAAERAKPEQRRAPAHHRWARRHARARRAARTGGWERRAPVEHQGGELEVGWAAEEVMWWEQHGHTVESSRELS